MPSATYRFANEISLVVKTPLGAWAQLWGEGTSAHRLYIGFQEKAKQNPRQLWFLRLRRAGETVCSVCAVICLSGKRQHLRTVQRRPETAAGRTKKPRISAGLISNAKASDVTWILLASTLQARNLRAVIGAVRHLQRPRPRSCLSRSERHVDGATAERGQGRPAERGGDTEVAGRRDRDAGERRAQVVLKPKRLRWTGRPDLLGHVGRGGRC